MKMFTCKFAQDEVTHQRLRAVQKSSSSKAAAILTRGAYTSYVSTEQWRPACALAREAAPAKVGNAAGGFFQQTHSGRRTIICSVLRIAIDHVRMGVGGMFLAVTGCYRETIMRVVDVACG